MLPHLKVGRTRFSRHTNYLEKQLDHHLMENGAALRALCTHNARPCSLACSLCFIFVCRLVGVPNWFGTYLICATQDEIATHSDNQASAPSCQTAPSLDRQNAATTAQELIALHEMPRAKPFKRPRAAAKPKRKRLAFDSLVSDCTSRIHTVTLNPVSPLRGTCSRARLKWCASDACTELWIGDPQTGQWWLANFTPTGATTCTFWSV